MGLLRLVMFFGGKDTQICKRWEMLFCGWRSLILPKFNPSDPYVMFDQLFVIDRATALTHPPQHFHNFPWKVRFNKAMESTISPENDAKVSLATLNSRQLSFLSQTSQEIRATVSHLSLPKVSPLSVLDSSAIDSLKDLYYVLNTEDPLNAMPIRRHVLSDNLPIDCLLQIAVAANSDPAAERNRKRWALPMYQTLRLLSVLTLPISPDSELPAPSQLDYLLLDLRAQLANDRKALNGFVSLLQYYVDRKSEKRAALAPAEDSKLEDARIDNILRFFNNILCPPRAGVGEDIAQHDRAVHLALVGSLVHVDFYSTIAVLFSSANDASEQYTDFIFLVADVYALTYRHSSPRHMFHVYQELTDEKFSSQRTTTRSRSAVKDPTGDVFGCPPSVPYEETSNKPPICKPTFKSQRSRKLPNLRDALLRERSAIGGSRAVTVGARWTSRHSGGFLRTSKITNDRPGKQNPRNPNGVKSISAGCILPARGAIQSNKAFNPKQAVQESVSINAQILRHFALKGRSSCNRTGSRSQVLSAIRHDFQVDGHQGLVAITNEILDSSFAFFVRELRERIIQTRERAHPDEMGSLAKAQRAFLTIVGSIVGFHREKVGKIYKHESSLDNDDFSNQLHLNNMTKILSREFKVVKTSWRDVEAAIELESFQLVFSVLVQACEQAKESGRDKAKFELVELATFSVLEMMKMLQGMAAVVPREVEEAPSCKLGDMTPREVALHTLEQLFERESFLNAPADLAKHYNSRLFSFRHLSNIIEMAHAFTTILLNEHELARLSIVKRKKKKPRAKQAEDDETVLHIDEGPTQPLEEAGTSGKTKVSTVSTGGVEKEDTREETVPNQIISNDIPYTTSMDTDSNQGLDSGTKVAGNEERGLTEVEKMLLADEEEQLVRREDVKSTSIKEPTLVEKLLSADAKANLLGAPKPTYVTKLGGGKIHDSDISEEENNDSENENLQEIESIGIVRRYANSKAIESLLIPVRAALCHASDLSGKCFPIPENAEALTVSSVVAKSACVTSSIWKVATKRERGALCGQFFSFNTLQLFSIALNAETDGSVRTESVLGHICEMAKDVTDVFFKWLKANPGLMYDLFLVMDKTYAMSMARKVNGLGENEVEVGIVQKENILDSEQKKVQNRENHAYGSDENYSSDEFDNEDPGSAEEELVKKVERSTSLGRPTSHHSRRISSRNLVKSHVRTQNRRVLSDHDENDDGVGENNASGCPENAVDSEKHLGIQNDNPSSIFKFDDYDSE